MPVTNAFDLGEADTWLYSTLAGDSTLMSYLTGVFSWYVPPNQTGKYIVYQMQSPGTDIRASGRIGVGIILSQPLFLVRVIAAEGDWAGLQAAALRMHTLLDNASGVTANGNRITVQREQPYERVEVQGPQQRWRHMGGMYRLYISGS